MSPRSAFPWWTKTTTVLGDAPRAEVHGNNLRHRAVHILIFNRSGEVFLQKRSRWKDRHPLLWDSSAAGHVDAGEEYDAAAMRELQEELGVSAELKRIVKLPASDQTGQEFIWLYRASHDGPFELAATEIEYGAFFPARTRCADGSRPAGRFRARLRGMLERIQPKLRRKRLTPLLRTATLFRAALTHRRAETAEAAIWQIAQNGALSFRAARRRLPCRHKPRR